MKSFKQLKHLLEDVDDNSHLPYKNKKCAVCNVPSHQGYNGRWYCNEHHPQKDKLHKNPKAS